jgi:hypothetical protein
MRHSRSQKAKKTAFVPRGLFVGALAAVSVVPICACGGSLAGSQDGGSDSAVFGVATDAYASSDRQAFHDGVALVFADASSDADSGQFFGVAVCCFDVAACCFDGSIDDATDESFGVALDAFGGDDTSLEGDGATDAGDGGLRIGVPPVAFDGSK